MGSSNTNRRYVRLWLVLFCLSIAGCSLPKLKSSLITGAATSAVVGVTSVLPGGVIVPTGAGGLTAATASALSAEDQGEPISVTADTVVNKAPDNFFTLLGKLVGMGGWLLGLVLLLPMVLGWIIPGPLKMHRRKKKS